MKRQVFLAAGVAAVVGGMVGFSCTTPQPEAECNFQNHYWAQYVLVDAGTGGSCSTYEGDRIDFQRYSPPGGSMTFAFLPRRVGRISRRDPCTSSFDGRYLRKDPSDTSFQKESPRGTFPSPYPDKAGFCSSTGDIAAAEQSFPEVTLADCLNAGLDRTDEDGGWNGTDVTPEDSFPIPATSYKDEWSNFRMVSTARNIQNIWEADVTVNRDSCSATYHVNGIFPFVGCTTDEDCNPEANLDAGRATGSGLSSDFKAKCTMFSDPEGYEASYAGAFMGTGPLPGVCMPTVSIDDIAKLK